MADGAGNDASADAGSAADVVAVDAAPLVIANDSAAAPTHARAVGDGGAAGQKRQRQDPLPDTDEGYRRRLTRVLGTMQRATLLEMLVSMGAQYEPVYDEIFRVANADPDARKVFVRSLDFDRTTDASLRAAMVAFGDIAEAVVIVEKATGRSKGYGFVVYKEVDGALAAVEAKSKEIDGRSAMLLPGNREAAEALAPAPQRPGAIGGSASASAAPSSGGHGGAGAPASSPATRDQRRFIVRGLPWETTTDTLLALFQRYGDIEEGAVVLDKATNKSRGFGFVTLRSLDAAHAVLAAPPSEIDGRRVAVTLAALGPSGPGGGGGGFGGVNGTPHAMGGRFPPQQYGMQAAGAMGAYGAAPGAGGMPPHYGYGAPPPQMPAAAPQLAAPAPGGGGYAYTGYPPAPAWGPPQPGQAPGGDYYGAIPGQAPPQYGTMAPLPQAPQPPQDAAGGGPWAYAQPPHGAPGGWPPAPYGYPQQQ